MADREFYRGCFLQTVDDKGRVSIPAPFRAALEANSPGAEVVLGVGTHEDFPCVAMRDQRWDGERHAQILQRQMQLLAEGKELELDGMRNIGGASDTAQYDKSGRFVLPGFYRDMAKIGGQAMFVGNYFEFEVWAPEVLLAWPGLSAAVRQRCEHLLNHKGGAA